MEVALTLREYVQAVIGAGPAGLVAARELLREGHSVKVFEQAPWLGGVWKLNEQIEDDPLGQNELRSAVHSSMYENLRTNLPREVMSFSADAPFLPAFMGVRCLGYPSLIPSTASSKLLMRMFWHVDEVMKLHRNRAQDSQAQLLALASLASADTTLYTDAMLASA